MWKSSLTVYSFPVSSFVSAELFSEFIDTVNITSDEEEEKGKECYIIKVSVPMLVQSLENLQKSGNKICVTEKLESLQDSGNKICAREKLKT